MDRLEITQWDDMKTLDINLYDGDICVETVTLRNGTLKAVGHLVEERQQGKNFVQYTFRGDK